MSIEEDKATNEINDSPSLKSSEEMTTDTPLLRIFKKLITESEEDKAANEINDLPLLERFKKMITEDDNEIDDHPFEKRIKEKILAMTEADKAANDISSLLELLDKLTIESTFEEYYEHSDYDVDYFESVLIKQTYGLCPECNQPNTDTNWCKECNSKRFQQNFGDWTSGNEHIDNFIRDSQLEPRNKNELLEWIPYTKLRNIKEITKGGFGIVYKGVWLDGLISHWDYEKQDWERVTHELNEQHYEDANNDSEIENPLESSEKYGYQIVIKSLLSKNDENFKKFLNEWKLHLKCQNKVTSNGSHLVPIHGITQDPVTKEYMVVMLYFSSGNLRDNLPKIKSNPNDKFSILYYITIQLEGIHKLGFVHGDFHSKNILYVPDGGATICDFGLCRTINQSNTENEICGIMPYMAPEVLRGEPYTKSADIYSFGIIMWELASGVPAFYNIPQDHLLTIDICKGERPEIKEGTMPEEYKELMKRCWDNDPEKRPTAKKLRLTFVEWSKKYPLEKDNEKRLPVPEHEPKTTCQPEAHYLSREYDSSLSSKIFVMDKTVTRDDCGDCIVLDKEK